MKPTTVFSITLVLAAMLFASSLALPPEFFRAGRRGFPVPVQKKSSVAGVDLLDAACAFCGGYSRELEAECRSSSSENRQVCVYAFLWSLENRDWQNQIGQQ